MRVVKVEEDWSCVKRRDVRCSGDGRRKRNEGGRWKRNGDGRRRGMEAEDGRGMETEKEVDWRQGA